MVQFSLARSSNPRSCSLRETIARVLCRQTNLLDVRQISIEVDIEADLQYAAVPQSLEHAFSAVLETAVRRCPRGSELHVSVYRTLRGVEYEIADSGSQLSDMPTSAFTRCDPRGLSGLPQPSGGWDNWLASEAPQFDLYCTRCPQGGLAWTLVARQERAQVRVA